MYLSESVLDSILKAVNISNVLNETGELISSGLFIVMIVKGLPPNFKPFITVNNPEEKKKLDFFKIKKF